MTKERISLLLVGLLLPAIVVAHGGDELVAKNPQLSQIPDWPHRSTNTGSVGLPEDCNKCAVHASLAAMRQQGDTPYRCVFYEGKFGGKAWESGGGEMKTFTLQLHPNSPMVWRVFPQGGYGFHAEKNLIAEFDITGKVLFSKSARSPAVPDRGVTSGPETSTDCRRSRPVQGGGIAGVMPGDQPAVPGLPPADSAQAPQKAVQDAATKALKGLFGR